MRVLQLRSRLTKSYRLTPAFFPVWNVALWLPTRGTIWKSVRLPFVGLSTVDDLHSVKFFIFIYLLLLFFPSEDFYQSPTVPIVHIY